MIVPLTACLPRPVLGFIWVYWMEDKKAASQRMMCVQMKGMEVGVVMKRQMEKIGQPQALHPLMVFIIFTTWIVLD